MVPLCCGMGATEFKCGSSDHPYIFPKKVSVFHSLKKVLSMSLRPWFFACILHTFQSVNQPHGNPRYSIRGNQGGRGKMLKGALTPPPPNRASHGQWPAPMGSWRVDYS